MRRFATTAILAALSVLIPQGNAQRNDPMNDFVIGEIGKTYGEMASEAINSAANYRKSLTEGAAEFNRDIAAARERFWREYPNGPNFHEASAEFAKKLMAKDLLMQYFYVWSSEMAPGQQRETPLDLIHKLLGVRPWRAFDSIRPIAFSHFMTYTDSVRSLMGRGGAMGLFDLPGRYLSALTDAAPAYRAYCRARDYAEFAAVGKLPPGVDGPRKICGVAGLSGCHPKTVPCGRVVVWSGPLHRC